MRGPSSRSLFIYHALHFSQLQLGLFSFLRSGKISSKVWLSLDFGVLGTTDILPTSLCEETRFSLHLCLHSSLEVSIKWEALPSHIGTWIWAKTSQSLNESLSCCISCSVGNGSISSEFANPLIFCCFSLCQEMDAGYDSAYLYKKKFHTLKQASEINGFITNSQSCMAALALIIDWWSVRREERCLQLSADQ